MLTSQESYWPRDCALLHGGRGTNAGKTEARGNHRVQALSGGGARRDSSRAPAGLRRRRRVSHCADFLSKRASQNYLPAREQERRLLEIGQGRSALAPQRCGGRFPQLRPIQVVSAAERIVEVGGACGFLFRWRSWGDGADFLLNTHGGSAGRPGESVLCSRPVVLRGDDLRKDGEKHVNEVRRRRGESRGGGLSCGAELAGSGENPGAVGARGQRNHSRTGIRGNHRGWNAVKKGLDGFFGGFSELKVAQAVGPHVQVWGDVACSTGITTAVARTKAGESMSLRVCDTQVLVKRGGAWRVVSNIALPVPH